jgi:hypothetical protein
MIKIVDLATDDQYRDQWIEFLVQITLSGDALAENYLELNPQEFLSFPAVLKDNKIICFSGLQVDPDRWGQGVARCSARMWIHSDYRQKGLSKFTGGDKFLNTFYCLPEQIKKAQEHNIKCLFISREHNLLGFKEYLKLIKINCNLEFQLQDSKYNVCGPKSVASNQYVAVLPLSDDGLDLWNNQMDPFSL